MSAPELTEARLTQISVLVSLAATSLKEITVEEIRAWDSLAQRDAAHYDAIGPITDAAHFCQESEARRAVARVAKAVRVLREVIEEERAE